MFGCGKVCECVCVSIYVSVWVGVFLFCVYMCFLVWVCKGAKVFALIYYIMQKSTAVFPVALVLTNVGVKDVHTDSPICIKTILATILLWMMVLHFTQSCHFVT